MPASRQAVAGLRLRAAQGLRDLLARGVEQDFYGRSSVGAVALRRRHGGTEDDTDVAAGAHAPPRQLRQDGVAPGHSRRQDRQVALEGEVEGAFLEWQQLTRTRAGALDEEDHLAANLAHRCFGNGANGGE